MGSWKRSENNFQHMCPDLTHVGGRIGETVPCGPRSQEREANENDPDGAYDPVPPCHGPCREARPSKVRFRDSSGKLLYKTYTRGSVTETRQPSGKLVTKSKTKDGKTDVRSPSGKLLFKVK